MIKTAWIKKVKAFLSLILFTASLFLVLGGTAHAVSDKSLIQLSGDTKVYWLQNNKIYHVYDATVLNTMQTAAIPGWSWSSITTVSSLSSYTVSPEFITTSGTSSNGLLIRLYGGSDVYYIGSGKKEYLSSTTFSTRSYSFNDVIDVPQSYLDMFSTLSLDLTVSATVSGSYSSGQSGVKIPVTVSRTGDQIIAGSYVLARLYWSTNTTWDGSDTQLWESNGSTPDYSVSYLNSYGSKQVTATVNIPSVSAGTYYILVVVDPESYHTENNENNNITAYTVSISTNTAPASPLTLKQYKSDQTTEFSAGGTTNETTVVMKGYVTDPDSDTVQLEVEARPTSQSFTNSSNCSSGVSQSSGGWPHATCSSLSDGSYHWQARAKDSKGNYSGWVDAGNADPSVDFIVSTVNNAPNSPSSLSQYKTDGTSITAGGSTNESSIKLKGYVSDPDSNQVKLQIELRTTSESFTGNYTNESGYVSSGSTAELTVSGLTNGNYQWKGRTVDSNGATSSWIDAGNSGADFIVSTSSSATLIQKSGDTKVYYVSNGYKYWIPDPETFEILGFSWSGITTVTQDSYIEGSPLSALKTGNAKYGSLIRRGSEIEVYIIENGLRRWIPDPNTLYAMGRTFNEVISLDGALFDRISRGDDIPSIDSNASNFIVYISDIAANGASVYDSGVNISNGSYAYQKDHIPIPGRGLSFDFATAYNAMDSYSSTMGQGWIHSYDITATEVQKTPSGGSKTNVFMRAKWGNGQEEWYQWNGSSYSALYGGHNTVSGGSGANTLTITTKSQIKYAFELSSSVAAASQDSSGNSTTITTNSYRVKTITDKNGNTITLKYSGLLSSITDTVGRTISFTYTQMTDSSNTVITRLTKVTDPINRTVEFTYDTDGRVIKIKDLNGGFTQLSYNEKVMGITNPLLKTVTDPRGNVIISASYTDINGASNINMADYKKATSVKMGIDTPAAFSYSGNTATVTDSMNYQTIYTNDTSNRLTQLTDPLSKNISLAYGDSSNPLAPSTLTDKRSYQTKFTYDANGNVTKITDPLNNATNFEYDGMNNVTKKTDALSRVTTYAYDSKGNLKTIAAPIGTVNITVNAYGQPETVTDANSNTTTYVYDSYGNLTEIREPLNRTTKFGYDTVGRKTSETDADSNVTSFAYDNNNNLLTVTHNATGKTITYQYDANGNRTSVTDENSNTTTYTYDERNRVTKVTNPESGATNYAYDSLNRLTQTTDANSKVTKYEYDAVGNLTKVTDAENGTVTYTYDANGNRLTMTDPNLKTTNYTTYDALNRLETRTEPGGSKYTYTYDAVGNMLSMKDAKSNTTSYTYDSMNRLKTVTYPDSSASFIYDSNGNRTSMTDGIGTSTYQYDALNRLTGYTDAYGKSVGYGYDANNNRTSVTYPGSKTVSYGYDGMNRLYTVTDWNGKTTTYSYDSASRLSGVTNGNNTASVYTYDKANRLTGLTNKYSNGNTISTYAYTLDPVGNQTGLSYTEPLSPVVSNANIAYSYDSENRLSSAEGVSYGYDSNGNLIAKGNDSLTYDYRDKLTQSVISGATVQYKYDGAGNRLARTEGGVTKRYVQDISSNLPNVIAETDGSGNVTAYYVYGLGLISKIETSGATYYYHYDSRGSAIALTDASQNVTDKYIYDPFGKVTGSEGSTANPFKYVGRYGLMDEGNGLTYIRARYYSPDLGRFITKDPLTGKENDSQSLNRYIYAVNNPAGLVDVSGMDAQPTNGFMEVYQNLKHNFNGMKNTKIIEIKQTQSSPLKEPDLSNNEDIRMYEKGKERINAMIGDAIEEKAPPLSKLSKYLCDKTNFCKNSSERFINALEKTPGGRRVIFAFGGGDSHLWYMNLTNWLLDLYHAIK